jgi:hypothetical protein
MPEPDIQVEPNTASNSATKLYMFQLCLPFSASHMILSLKQDYNGIICERIWQKTWNDP